MSTISNEKSYIFDTACSISLQQEKNVKTNHLFLVLVKVLSPTIFANLS